MTVEEQDLREYVTQFLALHGVAPKDMNEIEFLDAEGLTIEGLHIDIDCQIASIPPACPLCGASTQKSPAPRSQAAMKVSESSDASVLRDAASSDAEDLVDDDTEATPMSMAAIRATSDRLERERARERGEAPPPRTYMPGESEMPPGPTGV